jgi:hypothetical protein
MEIGEPKKTTRIEPVEEPVPAVLPIEEPVKEPEPAEVGRG